MYTGLIVGLLVTLSSSAGAFTPETGNARIASDELDRAVTTDRIVTRRETPESDERLLRRTIRRQATRDAARLIR